MEIYFLIVKDSCCLCINGYRITPAKLYGIGSKVDVFEVSLDFLKESCDENNKIEFEVYSCKNKYELCINGKPTQGRATIEEYQKYVKRIEDRRKRFLRTNGDHNWNLCTR